MNNLFLFLELITGILLNTSVFAQTQTVVITPGTSWTVPDGLYNITFKCRDEGVYARLNHLNISSVTFIPFSFGQDGACKNSENSVGFTAKALSETSNSLHEQFLKQSSLIIYPKHLLPNF